MFYVQILLPRVTSSQILGLLASNKANGIEDCALFIYFFFLLFKAVYNVHKIHSLDNEIQ